MALEFTVQTLSLYIAESKQISYSIFKRRTMKMFMITVLTLLFLLIYIDLFYKISLKYIEF